MQRQQLWLSVIILAGVFIAWTAYMGFANTQSTTLDVQVAAGVDEVRVFKASRPENPLAQLSGGQQQTLTLRNSDGYSFLAQTPAAEYYFVTRAGADTFQSQPICCTLGAAGRQRLVITSLREWQLTTP